MSNDTKYGIIQMLKCERKTMAVSYNNLWKTLIDKKMSKTDLRRAVGMSSGTLARLSKDESVGVSTLERICAVLQCKINDIVEVVPDNPLHEISNRRISVVSFFCGCGGLDLGFRGNFTYKDEKYERTRFDILKAYDFNKDAVATYRLNIGDHAEQLDLSDYDVNAVPKADLLIGGFPCQDFANCGPRRGLKSERGRLYKAMIKYANQYHPKMMIGENVPGLENIGKGKVLETILKDIREAGYSVEVWRLFAPDYGVPQTRRRLIIVAVRKDINDMYGFPKPPLPIFSKENYRTTKWAIGDLENVTDNSIPNQAQYSRATLATGGTGQGDDVCHADAPSYTIRANSKGRVEFHYSLKRRLTVRECARIQTFPDDFVFPHNNVCTNILEIGNAVPPVLGNTVAVSIQNFMEKIND